MPTPWNANCLGVTPILDPTEVNMVSENAASRAGTTFGAASDKDSEEAVSIQAINKGAPSRSLDKNNTAAKDQIRFDLGDGAAAVTTTNDGGGSPQGTVTCTDNTTWTGTILIAQDSLGTTDLVPQVALRAPQIVQAAKPSQSITINSLSSASFVGLQVDRQPPTFLTCSPLPTKDLSVDNGRRIQTLAPVGSGGDA